MSVQVGLYVKLSGDATLAGYVSTRIYPGGVRTSPTLPAITTRTKDGDSEYGLWDATPIRHTLVEIDCYAATYDEARAISDRVLVVLDRFRGLMDSSYVLRLTFDREEEMAEELNGTMVYKLRRWFQMAYQ